MRQILKRNGDDVTVIIDKEILERTKMAADTAVDVVEVGGNVVLRRLSDEPLSDAQFNALLEEVNAQYGDMLKRLAE